MEDRLRDMNDDGKTDAPPFTTGNSISLALKGAAMGAANVIPGVSGGTIALISGIYEELIHTLKSFDREALQLVIQRRFRDAFEHVNGRFVCILSIGLVISWFSLAKLFKHLLAAERTEIFTMAFFFGLIGASIFAVGQRVPRWGLQHVALLLLGAAVAGGIAFVPHAGEITSPFYIFLCGAIAMSAMILPGISGSFILLLMGAYLHVLTAISDFNFAVLIPFALGCITGLLAFSRALSFILKKFHDATLALLTGFVAGSLAVIWPWKTEIKSTHAIGGKTKEIVKGYDWYLPVTDNDLLLALLLIVTGAGLVPLLEHIARADDSPADGE